VLQRDTVERERGGECVCPVVNMAWGWGWRRSKNGTYPWKGAMSVSGLHWTTGRRQPRTAILAPQWSTSKPTPSRSDTPHYRQDGCHVHYCRPTSRVPRRTSSHLHKDTFHTRISQSISKSQDSCLHRYCSADGSQYMRLKLKEQRNSLTHVCNHCSSPCSPSESLSAEPHSPCAAARPQRSRVLRLTRQARRRRTLSSMFFKIFVQEFNGYGQARGLDCWVPQGREDVEHRRWNNKMQDKMLTCVV